MQLANTPGNGTIFATRELAIRDFLRAFGAEQGKTEQPRGGFDYSSISDLIEFINTVLRGSGMK
jgi:hypothetical protein